MTLDIVNIVAAAALVLPTCAAGVLGYLNNSKGRRIKALERSLEHSQDDIAEHRRQIATMKDEHQATLDTLTAQHVDHISLMEGANAHELQELTIERQQAISQAFDRTQRPLRDVSDEDLPHVVKKEVTLRCAGARQATLPWGKAAHKLATAVGGACFRVVDHCKRGHGAFAAFGPYNMPAASPVSLKAADPALEVSGD